jgi:outer membrane usher protein
MSRLARERPRPPLVLFRRLLGCACALILIPQGAWAQDQRAFLSMSVNGVDHDDTLVILREADTLIAVASLESAGLHGFAGRRETIDGAEFVSLSSLAPGVTFTRDDVDLRIAITADPTLLAVVVRDLDGGAPADMVFQSAPSAFVNYSATGGSDEAYELFTEAGISARGALLYATATRNTRGTVRGLSHVMLDRRSRLQRWTIGDNFATGGPLGGGALVAGVSVGREFSLAPYFVRHPTMSLSAPVTTPSVLEVHVNGRLVREEQVQPGLLDLRNLPMVAGRNETRLVLRDPFGAAREITSGFYLSSAALARGVHDYQYSAGWRRESLGTSSWDYREPVAIARHRLGLTDAVTAGLRVEGARGVISGGPSVNLRLPAGEIELAGGASRTSGASGAAAQASYMYSGAHVSFGAQVAQSGPDYATVTPRSPDARQGTSFNAFASIPTGHGSSVTAQHSETTGSEAIAQSRTALQGSARLLRSADLMLSLTRTRSAGISGVEASIGITMAFGPRTVASLSGQRTATGTQALLDVQRPLPIGTGYGYQFRTEGGERTAVSGVAQYQGNFGRYEVRRDAIGSSPKTTVNVSGGLVAIGGGLHATRAIRSSYALVRVPDVEGVHTFSSNQEVGRTGRRGNILVSDLLPYYGNKLSIADTDIPLDYQVPAVQVTLAPPYRGGAVALFAVRRIQRIVGSILLVNNRQEQRPSYGSVAVAVGGETMISPLGAAGEFYFESMAPGQYSATVTYNQSTCALTINIPVVDGPEVTLGILRCGEP